MDKSQYVETDLVISGSDNVEKAVAQDLSTKEKCQDDKKCMCNILEAHGEKQEDPDEDS